MHWASASCSSAPQRNISVISSPPIVFGIHGSSYGLSGGTNSQLSDQEPARTGLRAPHQCVHTSEKMPTLPKQFRVTKSRISTHENSWMSSHLHPPPQEQQGMKSYNKSRIIIIMIIKNISVWRRITVTDSLDVSYWYLWGSVVLI